ncbi:MAG: hypothetical protein ACOY0T_21585 [Myxococcota bacterium]
MRPLKHGEPRYPVEADAIELLRATPRFDPPPGQKQRITARLLAERGGRHRGRWFGAPVVVAFVLCAAGASAAVGGGWVTRGYQFITESLAPPQKAPAKSPAQRTSVSSARRSYVAPSLVERPTDAQPLAVPSTAALPMPTPHVDVPKLESTRGGTSSNPRRAEASASKAVERAQAVDAVPPVAESTPSTSEASPDKETSAPARGAVPSEASSLVVGAMRALRQEGRPDRAASLLDEYLRRYPGGALAEEALALSVEAATARGDSRARNLAERYLSSYPRGRFRQAAERARARFSK